jgi:UDP-N-acetylglucosamine 2-epimerase (non-hydrolysing)
MKKVEKSKALKTYSLQPKNYCVLTIHRPSNVDNKNALREVLEIIRSIQKRMKIIYPIHPRTKKMIKTHGLLNNFESLNDLIMIGPQGYIDFIKLVKESNFVLTDSGGIQEESTVLGVHCLTMRENTERPITIKKGTNYLVGRDYKKIISRVGQIMKNRSKKYVIPEFWDGYTSKRIVKILRDVLS